MGPSRDDDLSKSDHPLVTMDVSHSNSDTKLPSSPSPAIPSPFPTTEQARTLMHQVHSRANSANFFWTFVVDPIDLYLRH